MTEDEAFIRTLVDSPGDDTPRLAYADWLDEQGDPRGKYLRAETRIMRQWRDTRDFGVLLGGMTRLGEQGASLDPVWTARVSRSPIGVCCDHLRFQEPRDDMVRPRRTPAELDWVEQRFQLTLPADYRGFLLNYNGGVPDPGHFRIPGRPYDEGYYEAVVNFATIWSAAEPEIDADDDLVWRLIHLDEYRQVETRWLDEPLNNLMVVGLLPPGDLDWICLGCRGDQEGLVHAVAAWMPDDSLDDRAQIAPSFALFLSSLTDHDLPHVRAVKKGDLPALRNWLAGGGDVNEVHRGTRLVSYAVWYAQPGVLRELLAHGAITDDHLLRDAESRKNPEVIAVLRAHYSQKA